MLFRSICLLLLVWGSTAVAAAASPINAEPLLAPIPSPAAPGGGTLRSMPSGSNNPITDLRKANADYVKANEALAQANKDLGSATTAAQKTKQSVDNLQTSVGTLIDGLPPTAPVPETRDYVKKKAEIIEKEVELGNAKSKDADANAKVVDAKASVTKCEGDLKAAAEDLSAKASALLKAIDDANWPLPLSPPICLPLPPMPGGCPADISHLWSFPTATPMQ